MGKAQLTEEQRALVLADRQLTDASWGVQSRADLNLCAGEGLAVREVIMASAHGRADYLLYVDQRAVGVIEAKPLGTPLSGVEWHSAASTRSAGLTRALLAAAFSGLLADRTSDTEPAEESSA